MKRRALSVLSGLLIIFAGWFRCPSAIAQEVVAVLSSDSPPYEEALAGFQETYGHSVPTFRLSNDEPRIPGSAKIIVTFGGKAAFYPYAQGTTLIYALAPGILVTPEQHAGPLVKVRIMASAESLISRLKEVQPNMKRLAVLWISPTFGGHLRELQEPAQAHGISLLSERMNAADELPSVLRALKGRADAFWMEPDPSLITPGWFATAQEFARSNNIPMYVPVDSLVDKGASAAVSCSYRENGRTTGRLAVQAVAGQLKDGEVRSIENCSLSLNLTAAAQSGLTISADVIKKADRVLP